MTITRTTTHNHTTIYRTKYTVAHSSQNQTHTRGELESHRLAHTHNNTYKCSDTPPRQHPADTHLQDNRLNLENRGIRKTQQKSQHSTTHSPATTSHAHGSTAAAHPRTLHTHTHTVYTHTHWCFNLRYTHPAIDTRTSLVIRTNHNQTKHTHSTMYTRGRAHTYTRPQSA